MKRVFQEIAAFKAGGPTEKQLADVKEGLLRDYETNSKQNAYLLAQMTFKYEYGEDVAGVFTAPALFRAVSAEAIRDAARQYLDPANYVKVTLFPKGTAAPLR